MECSSTSIQHGTLLTIVSSLDRSNSSSLISSSFFFSHCGFCVRKKKQPVLSAFEAAPEVVPAGHDEAAKTLHGSYQALYRSMELTFAKQVRRHECLMAL